MSRHVSILDGEVNRNWHLTDNRGERHVLTLFHDTVTGARAAMLDYEEVLGSPGTTNVFNLVSGQVNIKFSIKDTGDSGQLSIIRKGLTGFTYQCELNGRIVLDTTSTVQNSEYEYEVTMPATVDVGSRVTGVTWYEVHVTRRADGQGTLVHRRFRDFFALHEQVESLMKGHHLRSSLPHFPGKKSKLWINHGDVSFVEDRRKSLEQYMRILLQLPHVSTLDSTRAFLGIVGNLRERSVVWESKELGIMLKSAADVAGGRIGGGTGASMGRDGQTGPQVVFSVLGNGKSPPDICPGDRLSKVNGESTDLMTLQAARSALSRASRPVMLHFLSPILRMDSSLAPLPDAFLRRRDSESTAQHDPSFADDGGPPLASGLLGPGPKSAKGSIREERSTGGSTSGAWGLRGVAPIRWPSWRRESDSSGDGSGVGVGSASARPPQLSTGKTWNPFEASGPSGGGSKARLGRPVGPFGDGTGAAGSRKVPASSGLFGEMAVDGALTGLNSSAADASRGDFKTISEGRTRPPGAGGWRQNGNGTETDIKVGEWMPSLTVGARSRLEPQPAPQPPSSSRGELSFQGVAPIEDRPVGSGLNEGRDQISASQSEDVGKWGAKGVTPVVGCDAMVFTGFRVGEGGRSNDFEGSAPLGWMDAGSRGRPSPDDSFSVLEPDALLDSSGAGGVRSSGEFVGKNSGTGPFGSDVFVEESSDDDVQDNPFA